MCELPLYKSERGLPTERPGDGHAGLWYDKFGQWSNTGSSWKEATFEKASWVARAAKHKVGDRKLIEQLIERRQRLLAALGGLAVCIQTNGRLVTGLGYRHPVENGFAWHPVLGTPFIPGSGLKGVARTWAELCEEPDVDRIFGPRSSGTGEHKAGSVMFVEAIPREPVQLVAEVMTPHYSPYYQGSAEPGDYHDPVPIPFLAVEAKASFLAGVIPASSDAVDDARRAHQWLLDALDMLGAGAKTATGYGRFKRDTGAERVWEALRQQRDEEEWLRKAGPEELRRREVAQLGEQELYERVLAYLERGELHDPVERAAFQKAARETPYVAFWKKGNPRNRRDCTTGGRKLKAAARLLDE